MTERLLLDTQLLIWAADDDRRLKAALRRRIAAAEAVYFSAASIWEMAIKVSIGKLHQNPAEMAALALTAGYRELPVLAVHAAAVAELPRHHADPFDRLLVTQALSERLTLLTSDRVLPAYGPHVVRI